MKKYENLAKAVYDIGKYSFTVLVIGPFVSEKFNWLFIASGCIFSIIAFWSAVMIERIKDKEEGNG